MKKSKHNYAKNTKSQFLLAEYMGDGECYSIRHTGILQKVSESEEKIAEFETKTNELEEKVSEFENDAKIIQILLKHLNIVACFTRKTLKS